MTSSRATLRFALVAGFGLTASLWLLASYMVSQRVSHTRREAEGLSARYLATQDVLSTVRAQVLFASVIVRDALLDPNPRPSAEYLAEVEGTYGGIDAALERYEPVLEGPNERARVQHLRDEISAFRRASLEILATDSRTWQTEARSLLQRVLPKRESVIAVSEELQSLNRAMYVAQQGETATLQAQLQRQVLLVLGIALGLSLIIAWAAYRHGVRLENRLIEQRRREQDISADLHRLSAGIVKVQEDERQRIARELHDEVGQALSALALELASAEHRLQRTHGRGDLREARALTDGALRAVRDLSQLLHPSVLEDLGLSAALRSFLRGIARRTDLDCTLTDDVVAARLPPDVERAVYRITQEAMTNILRHARARKVSVRLATDDERLSVEITDDGIGFELADTARFGRQSGLGLLSMRERVSHLGGSLVIDTAPGRGTRLVVELPLHPDVAERGQDGRSTRLATVGARDE